MKKLILAGVLLMIAAVTAFSGDDHTQPGQCKEGMCYVKDITNDEVLGVNDFVRTNCSIIDKANVACPRLSLEEKNKWRETFVKIGQMKCTDVSYGIGCECRKWFFNFQYWGKC